MAHKVTFTLSDNELDYLKHMAEQEDEASWRDYARHLWQSKLWEDREINDIWGTDEQ